LLFVRDVATTEPHPVFSVTVSAPTTPETVITGPSFRTYATSTSPDGRYLAYTAFDGLPQVMVAEATGSRRFKISPSGGLQPAWGRDARELFFLTPQGEMMAVPVSPGPVFGEPSKLMRPCEGTAPPSAFPVGPAARTFAVTGDGQRVLAICEGANAAMHVTAALDWQLRLR
jgi:hypothetical protein